MAGTTNIPLTTLAVGSHDFGPAAIADSDISVKLVIDRTVPNGLNSQPATTVISVALAQSNDGGVTWQNLASGGGIEGGSYIGKTGTTITQSTLFTYFAVGVSRQVKATVTVAGAPVAVAGTVTTQ